MPPRRAGALVLATGAVILLTFQAGCGGNGDASLSWSIQRLGEPSSTGPRPNSVRETPSPTPQSRVIHAAVGMGCVVDGSDARISDVSVDYSHDFVSISFSGKQSSSPLLCLTVWNRDVDLPEPLGDRALMDGGHLICSRADVTSSSCRGKY